MTQKNFSDNSSALGGADHGLDIVADPQDLPQPIRFLMVSTDDTVITGILRGDTTEHTTFGLKAGIYHFLRFKRITAITGGTVKGYY